MRYMVLIYTAEQEPAATGAAAPDLTPWLEYTRWLEGQGIYRGADQLAPSTAATTVRIQGGQRLVTDGPFAETREVLGGYYMLECDLDAALEAAARCPGALYGSVEVRPIVDMELPS